MAVMGGVFLVVLGIFVGLGVLVSRAIPSPVEAPRGAPAGVGSAGRAEAAAALRADAVRHGCAVAAAVAAGALCVAAQAAWPGLVGLPLLVAPSLMWLAWAAVHAAASLWATRTVHGIQPGPRSARLEVRTARAHGPAWAFVLPALLGALLAAAVLLFGAVSTPDETGRRRQFPRVGISAWTTDDAGFVTELHYGTGAAGPFPGWYYGLPVLAVAALGGVLLLVALRAVAARARPLDPALAGFDDTRRMLEGHLLALVSAAFLALQLALVLLMAFGPLRRAGDRVGFEVGDRIGDVVPDFVTEGPWAVIGAATGWAGALLLLAAVVLGVAALRRLAALARAAAGAGAAAAPAVP